MITFYYINNKIRLKSANIIYWLQGHSQWSETFFMVAQKAEDILSHNNICQKLCIKYATIKINKYMKNKMGLTY